MVGLTIGQLAKQGGVNLETVRFYERRGLLPEPPRSPAGYRRYPSTAVQRLRFIKRAQELGFSLHEIKELLELQVTPGMSCADVRARAQAKLADVEAKIRSLQEIKKALTTLTNACAGQGPLSQCNILENLRDGTRG